MLLATNLEKEPPGFMARRTFATQDLWSLVLTLRYVDRSASSKPIICRAGVNTVKYALEY